MPHLADYTLRAWTRAAATDLDAQLPQLMPDEDITLLAHLTQEKPEGETYTVTYDTQCALTVAPRTVAPSLPIPRPDPGAQFSHTFIDTYFILTTLFTNKLNITLTIRTHSMVKEYSTIRSNRQTLIHITGFTVTTSTNTVVGAGVLCPS